MSNFAYISFLFFLLGVENVFRHFMDILAFHRVMLPLWMLLATVTILVSAFNDISYNRV